MSPEAPPKSSVWKPLSPSFSFYMWRGWDSERERESMTYSRSLNGWANIRASPHPIFRWRNWSSGMLTLTQEFSGGKWWNHNYDLLIFSLVHFIKTLTPLPQLPSMEIVSGTSVLRLSVHHSPYRLRACAHTPCLCILLILFPSKPTRINTSVSLFFSKSSQCFTPDPVMSPMCAGPASWVCTQGPWIWIDAF